MLVPVDGPEVRAGPGGRVLGPGSDGTWGVCVHQTGVARLAHGLETGTGVGRLWGGRIDIEELELEAAAKDSVLSGFSPLG